jgi:hypothetical protein
MGCLTMLLLQLLRYACRITVPKICAPPGSFEVSACRITDLDILLYLPAESLTLTSCCICLQNH